MPRLYRVVSPHLDDAALSVTKFLGANPGACLTTVFAAGPDEVSPLPPWDSLARFFHEGADVTGIRRAEDQRAAAMVGASVQHLPFWDGQYRDEDTYGYDGPDDEDLPDAIADFLLSESGEPAADAWLIPLGLGHTDHRLAAEGSLLAAERLLDGAAPDGAEVPDIYVYEDLPYAVEYPGEVEERKQDLADRGFTLEPDDSLEFREDRAFKRTVFRCHESQQRLLRWRAKKAIRTRERIWRLQRS